MRRSFWAFFLGLLLLGASSCSITKHVPDGQALLVKNKINVQPEHTVSPQTLTPYLRQKPNTNVLLGWPMFLSIYNISGMAPTSWNRFWQRIGEAPVIYDTLLARQSLVNIDNYLQSVGYFQNEMRDSVFVKRKRARAYYNVRLGNTYIIDTITSTITDPQSLAWYNAHREESFLAPGQRLMATTLEQEAARIGSGMRNDGYYTFLNNFVSFLADTLAHNGTAHLDLRITPTDAQRRHFIRNVSIYSDFDPLQEVQDSNYYASMDSLRYGNMMFYYSGRKPTIRPRFARQLCLLEEGDMYNESQVENTYNRFSSLPLYNGVTLLFDEVQDQDGLLDCTIRLNPGKLQGYQIRMEASSNSNGLIGISPTLTYTHKNLFRGGEHLTLGFKGNFQFMVKTPVHSNEFGTNLTLSLPKLLFPVPSRYFRTTLPRTEIRASYNYQQRPEYARNMGSLAFGYTWRMDNKRYYNINPLNLNIIKMSHLADYFLYSLRDPYLRETYRDHLVMGFSHSFHYTTQKETTPKETYYYLRTSFESSGNFLSLFNGQLHRDSTGARLIAGIPYAQFIKVDVNTAYTWFVTPRQQLVGHLYAGIGIPYGNSATLPLEQRFIGGGANSMRAWQARTLGPGSMPQDSTFTIPNQNGDIKLELNLEYRFPIVSKLEGAAFVDMGNVWNARKNPSLPNPSQGHISEFGKSLAIDVGIGLRLNLGILVLRLDFAQILRDPILTDWLPFKQWARNGTCSLQFGIGYPF